MPGLRDFGDLSDELGAYADAYKAAYSLGESVTDPVPYMLRAFIDSDRTFVRARRSSLRNV